VMIKEGEGLFLDDVSLEDLQRRLGRPVLTFDCTPRGCYRALRQMARLGAGRFLSATPRPPGTR